MWMASHRISTTGVYITLVLSPESNRATLSLSQAPPVDSDEISKTFSPLQMSNSPTFNLNESRFPKDCDNLSPLSAQRIQDFSLQFFPTKNLSQDINLFSGPKAYLFQTSVAFSTEFIFAGTKTSLLAGWKNENFVARDAIVSPLPRVPGI